MPAATINLLFIFNLLDHLGLFETLCQGRGEKSLFPGNFDMSIIEDLLLLG